MSLTPKVITEAFPEPLGKQLRRMVMYSIPFLGRVAMDPSPSNLGPEDEGLCWYNEADHMYRYWDGTAIQNGMG